MRPGKYHKHSAKMEAVMKHVYVFESVMSDELSIPVILKTV